jgi:hypothetical protein
MVRTHQPGEAVFRSILPEDIDWKPFAALRSCYEDVEQSYAFFPPLNDSVRAFISMPYLCWALYAREAQP